MNVWRDNEEHRKSAEEEVIGSEEDPKETHDEEEEDQEEEDEIPNFEIDYDNGDNHGLDSEYKSENLTISYVGIIMVGYLLI